MSGSEPGRREVAYRLFAAEFDDAEFSYSESDEERAPNYVVTPTGARVNRLFAVGVLTEIEDVNPEMIRGRIVDPTGAFVTYAGQYQPDALANLERMDPPAFLSIAGKARTFEPDDGDQIFTSVRPESVNEVDAETRDRWVLTTAERTRERIGVMASAIESELVGDQLRAALVEADVDERLADGVALALDHYGTTPAYLAELDALALDAVRVVAGERDEVGRLDAAPDEGVGDAAALATLDLAAAPSPETAAAAAGVGSESETEAESQSGDAGRSPASDADAAPEEETPELGDEPMADAEAETETKPDVDAGAEIEDARGDDESETDPEPTDSTEPVEAESETDGEPAADLGGTVGSTTGETSETGDETGAAVDDDFDPGEFELDEDERREVEEEYGTEFSTADEVEPAGIEPEAAVEDPDALSKPESEPESEPVGETADAGGADEPDEPDREADPTVSADDGTEGDVGGHEEEDDDDETAATDAGDVDLEDAVMEAMDRLDDGDGADRDELVATIADEHGADADAIEEAIQDALMSGQCYEPTEGTLKSI